MNEPLDFVQKLIDGVRRRKLLYDKKNAFYYNRLIKEKAWEEISVEVNKPVRLCREKWKLLRERFSREIKKMEMTSDGLPGEITWDLYEEMNFVRDSMKRRTKYGDVEEVLPFPSVNCNTSADDDDDTTPQWPKREKADEQNPLRDSMKPRIIHCSKDVTQVDPFKTVGFPPSADDLNDDTPTQRPKRQKTGEAFDGVCLRFGNALEKLEQHLSAVAPPAAIADADELYMRTIMSFMKDLPRPVSDSFKAEMFNRVMVLRNENLK